MRGEIEGLVSGYKMLPKIEELTLEGLVEEEDEEGEGGRSRREVEESRSRGDEESRRRVDEETRSREGNSESSGGAKKWRSKHRIGIAIGDGE
jgi:hypothetical protein